MMTLVLACFFAGMWLLVAGSAVVGALVATLGCVLGFAFLLLT
ncbi:MAG: hypothetical protein WAQ33_06980 [Gaiellaceae bacterium]